MGYGMAASGAAEGAAAGAAFGPWGAVIGGALGALGGMGKAKEARKARREVRAGIRQQYAENYRQLNMQRRSLLGTQAAGYAAAGVEVGLGTPTVAAAEVESEYARTMAAAASAEKKALKAVSPNTNWWSIGASALGAAGGVKSSLATASANKAARSAAVPVTESKPTWTRGGGGLAARQTGSAAGPG
jgi:hypothetical protein